MTKDDKETYLKGRPYIQGIIALLFSFGYDGLEFFRYFEMAEEFLKEFERRNLQ